VLLLAGVVLLGRVVVITDISIQHSTLSKDGAHSRA